MADTPSLKQRRMIRVHPHAPFDTQLDWVSVEEPLEIRVHSEVMATTMRTPGNDDVLALGFLFSEGLIHSLRHVSQIAHCGVPGTESYGNVLEVTCAAGYRFDFERLDNLRRGTLTTSACGVCGRRNIEDLLSLCGPLSDAHRFEAALISQSPQTLASAQQTFKFSGGLHAAGVLNADGKLLAAYEDVGRHNAVDKVIGHLLKTSQIEAARVLVVSGRSSFEIVQKAAMANIPVVASVSAPSSLAIDFAERVNITLAGFVREGHFNLYTHPERILGIPAW